MRKSETLSLDTLAVRIAQADRKAFRMFFARTAPKAYGLALQLVAGDPATAQRVVAQAYADTWQTAGQFRTGPQDPLCALMVRVRDAARAGAPRTGGPVPPVPADVGLPGVGAVRNALIARAYWTVTDYATLARDAAVDAETARGWVQDALRTGLAGADIPVAAAEYALGLLPGPEAAALADDVLFGGPVGDAIDRAAHRFARIGLAVPAVDPPETLWPRIDSAIAAPGGRALWTALWPYAAGAALAVVILWMAQGAVLGP